MTGFKIRRRRNSFGVTVEPNNHEFSFDYSPQSFVRAMLSLAGFSIEYPEEFNVEEIFDFRFSLIESLIQDKQQGTQKKNHTVTSSLAFAKTTRTQRLNQLNVPKTENKIQMIEEYLESHFGEQYTKKNILAFSKIFVLKLTLPFHFQNHRLQNKNFLIFYSIIWVPSIQ